MLYRGIVLIGIFVLGVSFQPGAEVVVAQSEKRGGGVVKTPQKAGAATSTTKSEEGASPSVSGKPATDAPPAKPAGSPAKQAKRFFPERRWSRSP